jgi:predicted nucleic-acid-binding protein
MGGAEMIGLDTNILVRYLVPDDPAQHQRAVSFITRRLSPEHPGFINHIVLCELVWVLQSGYRYRKELIITNLSALFGTPAFLIEGEDLVIEALHLYRAHGADFSDCLLGLVNHKAGCVTTRTFDMDAARMQHFRMLKEDV